MPEGSRLTIPEEARTAAAEAMEDAAVELIGRDLGTIHRDEIAGRAVRAAAPLIVAAELQRLADAIDTLSAEPGNAVLRAEAAGRREIRQALLGRAAELRGGETS